MTVTEQDLDTAIEEMKAFQALPSKHCVLTVAARRQFKGVKQTFGRWIIKEDQSSFEFEDVQLAIHVESLFDNKEYDAVRALLPLELGTT